MRITKLKDVRVLLYAVTIAVLALFAACERPEPEPEPPTPPAVDTDTLPVNRFVGTWVLCAQYPVGEESSCDCPDGFTSIDTLVFTPDNTLTIRHGSESKVFFYDYTPSFFIYGFPEQQLSPNRLFYDFQMDGNELRISGPISCIPGSGSQTTSCFVRIDTPAVGLAVTPEVPACNRFLGIWASCCWTTDLNEDPDYNCEPGGDTLVFTENTMIQKTTWCGVVENGYEFTNTYSYLVYFRENLGYHLPHYINKTKFINDTILIIYAWTYPAYNPTEGQYYNVSYKKIQ